MSGISSVRRILLDEFPSGSGGMYVLNTPHLESHKFVRFFFFAGLQPGTIRGDHAHKRCGQLFISMGEGVKIELRDTEGKALVINSDVRVAYYVPPMIWVTLTFFSESAKMLVAATEEFSEEDYIRRIEDFFGVLE